MPPPVPAPAHDAPRATDAHRSLFPYQREGVEFLAARRVALLLDGMGLGKSAQAIRAADAIGARRLLII